MDFSWQFKAFVYFQSLATRGFEGSETLNEDKDSENLFKYLILNFISKLFLSAETWTQRAFKLQTKYLKTSTFYGGWKRWLQDVFFKSLGRHWKKTFTQTSYSYLTLHHKSIIVAYWALKRIKRQFTCWHLITYIETWSDSINARYTSYLYLFTILPFLWILCQLNG